MSSRDSNLKVKKTKLKFKFLEHKADAYIEAFGKTLKETFENCALATFEVMTDTQNVEARKKEKIEVEGFDEKALLYNWLEALLVRFELKQILYKDFVIQNIKKDPSGLRMMATIAGEKFDPKKHSQKVGVKAVTYHQMEIIKDPGKVTVRFILDI